MSKTITNLSTLKINYLTSQQYQTALEAGEIDPNELYLTPASGRGSSVTYDSILSTGTAIGRINIDGAPYVIYAPTPPTATSDLTNDSNFVVDSSYVHTDNNYTATEKDKLSGIASGAEVNQNAFTTVKVGTTNLVADAKSDTLTITAGSNITLTPTASSDSFTIAATDTKVTQTNTTDSADYRVLFSENANDTTQTVGARKSSKLKFNPSTGNLQATQFNGYTLAAAAGKGVDTSISDSSTSTNLPTSAAVASFVQNKGYITSADVPEGAAASTTTPKPISDTAAIGTQTAFARGDHVHAISFATTSVGSASTGTAIPADDITAWTTNTPTSVTKKTVVTGGTTTAITPVTSKTVVTSASGATASYSAGILTLTNGSFGTGASVTTGTAVNAYTSLTTGDSVDVTPGTAASLSYTAKSIPNISVSSKTVVTGLSE